MMNIELSTKSKRVAKAHEMLDAGFTRKEIAEAMGLKYHTVVRYFNSQEKPIVTDAMLQQMLRLHQESRELERSGEATRNDAASDPILARGR